MIDSQEKNLLKIKVLKNIQIIVYRNFEYRKKGRYNLKKNSKNIQINMARYSRGSQ